MAQLVRRTVTFKADVLVLVEESTAEGAFAQHFEERAKAASKLEQAFTPGASMTIGNKSESFEATLIVSEVAP